MDLAMDGCIDWKDNFLCTEHSLREGIKRGTEKGLEKKRRLGIFSFIIDQIPLKKRVKTLSLASRLHTCQPQAPTLMRPSPNGSL